MSASHIGGGDGGEVGVGSRSANVKFSRFDGGEG